MDMFYISPQEREIRVPILSRSVFPWSCTEFAFPRARVPKMPGKQERESRNAGPSLVVVTGGVVLRGAWWWQGREGRVFLYAFASRVPAFLDFSLAFQYTICFLEF